MVAATLPIFDPTMGFRGRRPIGNRRLLIATGVLVTAAAVPSLRIEVGGLFVPLHVLPIILALPTIVVPSFQRFQPQIRNAMLVFLGLFAFSVLRWGSSFGDIMKMLTSVMTVIAVGLMVGRREHFVSAVTALAVSLILVNANGIRGGAVDFVGYQPLAGVGNKNAYSIYALPIVLLAGFGWLHFRMTLRAKILLGAAIVTSVFVLFSGANRSGWGGLIMIAGLLAVQTRRWRTLFVVGALGAISYGALTFLGTSTTFEHRVQQTEEGYSSDDIRVRMLEVALDVAVENPLLGATPQGLSYELAQRIGGDAPRLDPHNFIGYVAGGSGFPALLALLAVAVLCWRRPEKYLTPDVRAATDLVRMVVVLFFVRGLFSREVFFVGPFPIALGLALGLVRASYEEAADLDSGASIGA